MGKSVITWPYSKGFPGILSSHFFLGENAKPVGPTERVVTSYTTRPGLPFPNSSTPNSPTSADRNQE